jgi:hypothetical protein
MDNRGSEVVLDEMTNEAWNLLGMFKISFINVDAG